MVGTAVFTMVASRFSMNSATATSHGMNRLVCSRESGATGMGLR